MNNLLRFSSKLINISQRAKISDNIRLFSQNKINISRTVTSKNVPKEEETVEDSTPIQYTKSPAYKWSAESSRTGVATPRLWYEPYVILGSIVIFMIYFCLIREENQIDKELERTLYSRISGLEEYQLKASLEHNRSKGLSTNEIEARLHELSRNKS